MMSSLFHVTFFDELTVTNSIKYNMSYDINIIHTYDNVRWLSSKHMVCFTIRVQYCKIHFSVPFEKLKLHNII